MTGVLCTVCGAQLYLFIFSAWLACFLNTSYLHRYSVKRIPNPNQVMCHVKLDTSYSIHLSRSLFLKYNTYRQTLCLFSKTLCEMTFDRFILKDQHRQCNMVESSAIYPHKLTTMFFQITITLTRNFLTLTWIGICFMLINTNYSKLSVNTVIPIHVIAYNK